MIIIPQGLTSQEIRVLQEFRRLASETLSLEAIKNIRHPVGGGEAPAAALAASGYLTAGEGSFTLTEKAREFLSIDARPAIGETSDAAASAAADPEADGA